VDTCDTCKYLTHVSPWRYSNRTRSCSNSALDDEDSIPFGPPEGFGCTFHAWPDGATTPQDKELLALLKSTPGVKVYQAGDEWLAVAPDDTAEWALYRSGFARFARTVRVTNAEDTPGLELSLERMTEIQ
jgi:hypothetical protein